MDGIQRLTVLIERDEEGYYVASVSELPGWHTRARTLGELFSRLQEAIELCLEADQEIADEVRDRLLRQRQEVIDGGRSLEDVLIDQALEMYQAGAGSLGGVAEKMGLSERDLIREARARGIEPRYSEETVKEELDTEE